MDYRHLPIIIAIVSVGLVYLYWDMNKRNQQLEEQLYYLQAHVQRLTTPRPDMQEAREPIELVDEEESQEMVQDVERVIEDIDYGYEEDTSGDDSGPEPVEQTLDLTGEVVEEVTHNEDIVITKFSHCPHILQSGKNKGSGCGKQACENGFCKNHTAPQPL